MVLIWCNVCWVAGWLMRSNHRSPCKILGKKRLTLGCSVVDSGPQAKPEKRIPPRSEFGRCGSYFGGLNSMVWMAESLNRHLQFTWLHFKMLCKPSLADRVHVSLGWQQLKTFWRICFEAKCQIASSVCILKMWLTVDLTVDSTVVFCSFLLSLMDS